MADLDLPELEAGLAHHREGRVRAAEAVYRGVLARRANHPRATHLLGLLLLQSGRLEAAVGFLSRAVQIDPANAEAQLQLGDALVAQGRCGEAVEVLGRALRIAPDRAEIHMQLGAAHATMGALDAAIPCFRRAAELVPGDPLGHHSLGKALLMQGRMGEAAAALRLAAELAPEWLEAHYNLGCALAQSGEPDQALTAFRRSLELRPDLAEAHTAIGNILFARRRFQEALEAHRNAVQLQPGLPEAHSNLALALLELGRLDEAEAAFGRALQLRPGFVQARANLGNVLQHQGRPEEAVATFRRAADLDPRDAALHSRLLFAMNFLPEEDPEALRQEARRWELRHAQPLRARAQPPRNDPDPGRRLKVGYVSADLRMHSVGRFLAPLLEQHDSGQVEVYCYSSAACVDAWTEKLRRHSHQWTEAHGMPEEALADRIRADGIDILVDLSLHSGDNRLLAFARKPAPVQVTYLGYAGSTGLSAMDYRLSDRILDPPGANGQWYEERTEYLESYWCFQPVETAVEPGGLPALARGHATFGCLNAFAKVNPRVLEVWARILQQVPGSRLVLHAREGSHRARTVDFLAERGIQPDRIEWKGMTDFTGFLRCHQDIDVGLDPFPFNGGTTTCDALWMGVPVVTLAGRLAQARAGASLLTAVGLQELVCATPEAYVDSAVRLATDAERLAALRAGLRKRMQGSVLMDGPRFARSVEAAYRRMWRSWCEGAGRGPGDC